MSFILAPLPVVRTNISKWEEIADAISQEILIVGNNSEEMQARIIGLNNIAKRLQPSSYNEFLSDVRVIDFLGINMCWHLKNTFRFM